MTLTHDFDLESSASYGSDLLTCKSFRVIGQSLPKIEWKQTDGRTDGGDCITSFANVVANIESHRFVAIVVMTTAVQDAYEKNPPRKLRKFSGANQGFFT